MKKVASGEGDVPVSMTVPPMLNGTFNPEFFRRIQQAYVSRTGYNLVLSDTSGTIQMGLPDCERFPCMRSCRECREQIVAEALRTGRVCIDTCHEGYILWGLPFALNGKTVGGLIVIGGEQEAKSQSESFSEACAELYHLMNEHQLLPEAGLPGSPDFSHIHRFVFRKAFKKLSSDLEVHGYPLIQALQSAEFDQAERHFEAIRKGFRSHPDLPMDVVRGLLGELIFRASRQLADSGMDAYACSSEAGLLIESLSLATDASQVDVILENFFQRFIALARRRTKDPDDLLIQRATTFLEQHIREDLTRETVAKAVGISPSHLSRLIREKKGRTFTDLLNQYRIERAAMLLVRSTQTLAQIASNTGFCDQSYFSKVFRRYKDMSPARYREEHQL